MPRASPSCCVRHDNVYRLFICLFQFVCVVTLLSTTSYIVDIRSRYHPHRSDLPALVKYIERLWNASALPRPVVAAAPEPHWFAVQASDVAFSRNLSASRSRIGPVTFAAVYSYGLEKREFLWSAQFGPMTTTTAETTADVPSLHLHIFFMHGNAGSHRQGEYWSYAVQHASGLLGVPISTYAFQWAEQANVHRGRLVELQADYAADVIEAVVGAAAAATTNRSVAHRVWLVGHSMGGVVARLTAQLLGRFIDVGGIVTFNCPHQFPPLLLDAPMASVYHALLTVEQASPIVQDDRTLPAAAVDDSHVHLSSTSFLQFCGASTEEVCVRHRRRQNHTPHLIAITSGEMDLQIEPATAYPAPWSSQYVVSFFNTLHSVVCAHSASHDGILLDPCAVTLGALQLFSASIREVQNRTKPTAAERNAADIMRLSMAQAQLPLPPGILSHVSFVGQLLWQQHMWPWAVAALYGYALLAGLWPAIMLMAETLLDNWPAWCGAGRQLIGPLRWVVSSEFSVAIFLVFFYSCTCTYATLTALYLAVTGRRGWYSVVHPWQCAVYPQLRHTSTTLVAPFQFAASTVFFFLTSVGPVTVGVNAGMALMMIGDVTQRVRARVGRCRCLLRTSRRRRVTTFGFPIAVAACYFVFLFHGVDPTARAIVWLVLFLVVPRPQLTPVTLPSSAASPSRFGDAVEVVFPADVMLRKQSAQAGACNAQHFPGMIYAFLYLIQLHPFFTIRNAIVSRTYEGAPMVDRRNYIAECGLLVLLCGAAVRSTLLLVPLQMWRSKLLGCVGLVSCPLSLAAVGWMLARPLESFQVLPALLWCFPGFLLLTLRA